MNTYNSNFTQMTVEELKNLQDTLWSQYQSLVEATKKNVADILYMIDAPLIVDTVEDWNNRIILRLDNGSFDRFSFYTQKEKLLDDDNRLKFMMDTPYSCGAIEALNPNDSHILYYQTYGKIVTNKEFLSAIQKIQTEFAEAVQPLCDYAHSVGREINAREVQQKKDAEQKQRDDFFQSIEEFLLDPENSEKWVAGTVTDNLDKKTGITYRNKPFSIKTTVGGTWLFDSEHQIDKLRFYCYNEGDTEESRENRNRFRYTTAVQVKMLKSDKTGKWINRPKKVKLC